VFVFVGGFFVGVGVGRLEMLVGGRVDMGGAVGGVYVGTTVPPAMSYT